MLKKVWDKIRNLFKKGKYEGQIVFENYDEKQKLMAVVKFPMFKNSILNEFFENLEMHNQSGVHVFMREKDVVVHFSGGYNIQINGNWRMDCVQMNFNNRYDVLSFDDGFSYKYSKIKKIVID
jgi:hypothetical protein